MNVQISKRHLCMLKELAANYYSRKGDPPEDINKVVERMIENAWREAHPREYQTTGFDRQ